MVQTINQSELEKSLNFFNHVMAMALIFGLIFMFVLGLFFGLQGILGLIVGLLLVEINLFFLKRGIKYQFSKNDGSRIFKKTLFYFYLSFLLNIIICILIIKFKIGEPISFVVGLSCFFLAMLFSAITFKLKK